MAKSNAMDFAEVVQRMMDHYTVQISEAVQATIPEVANEAAKKLRQTAPRRPGGGQYAKSWKVKHEKGRLKVGATVYADAPGYRLAHLLEFGHAKRGGGRVNGIVHIEPVERWANDEVWDRALRRIEKAGV